MTFSYMYVSFTIFFRGFFTPILALPILHRTVWHSVYASIVYISRHVRCVLQANITNAWLLFLGYYQVWLFAANDDNL